MTNFKEQLQNAAKDIRLSDAEKRDMRAALARAMGAPSPVKVVKSPYVFLSYTWMRAMAAFALVIFTGGSTAFASQSALPGEPLYALKTQIIEPMQLALASTPAAKAAVHAELAEKRVEEAEVLAKKGSLDASQSDVLAAKFDAHSDAAVALADEASKDDPSIAVEIKTRVRVSSSAGGAVLAALGKKSGKDDVRQNSDALAVRILARAESGEGSSARAMAFSAPAPKILTLSVTADATATAPADIAPQAAVVNPAQAETAARLQEKASRALTDARKALESSTLNASTTVDVETSLAQVDELMAQGAAQLGADSFDEAVRLFTEAYARSVKLQVLLKAHKSFNDNIVEPLLKLDSEGDRDD